MDNAESSSAGTEKNAERAPAAGAPAHDSSAHESEQFSTTLVEVSPGIAVVFGEVPDELELLDLDILPQTDVLQLGNLLASIGNAGTAVGNLGQAMSAAKGLYRVNDATASLLSSGARLAAKDGANLGAVFQNGKIVAQARFIPVSMTTATALASVGPAVAMLAMQMQLSEISGLVRNNIAITTQTLKTIQNEQWSELEAIVEVLETSVNQIKQLGSVPDSLWDSIASNDHNVRKQLKLYRKNVKSHLGELAAHKAQTRRNYLEINAEAIVFDTHALLRALKAHGQYQSVKALRARARGAEDAAEAHLFDIITATIPQEIQADRDELSTLAEQLMRELRIIAELPGRATIPLTTKRKDSKAVRVTCAALIEAIEPIVTALRAPNELPATPSALCAPKDLELDPYLRILRWTLEPGEKLHGVAFPYPVGGGKTPAMLAVLIAQRVDASWDSLNPNKKGAIADKIASATFVAVTDRRLITGAARSFLREAKIETEIPLSDIRFVRPPVQQDPSTRATVGITTEHDDIKWAFPAFADTAQINRFVEVIEGCRQQAEQDRDDAKPLDDSKTDGLTAVNPQ